MILGCNRVHRFPCGIMAMLVVVFTMGCGTSEPRARHMLPTSSNANEATTRFHQIVTEGTLEELQAALKGEIDINAPGWMGNTALMLAIGEKDLETAKLLLAHGADPELADNHNSTALKHAVEADFPDGVQLLLNLGVDRGYHPKYPLKQIDYGSMLTDIWSNLKIPAGLEAVMSEEQWKSSLEASRKSLQERGENPTAEPIISEVQSVEVLKLFLEAGDDLNLAPTGVKRSFIGLETGGELSIELSEYQKHKSPRFGSSNPERMDFPFWKDMIRTGGNAYSARSKFDDTQLCNSRGAVWCYDRFGSSLTPLKDGRFVQIGGEHEDYYDPDFVIYNDVVIHDGKGNFKIFGYPRDVFPPTDFHTATLCRDGIYIIGCLGYMDQRRSDFTPVYRLTLDSWRIEPIKTTGEVPGWIHRHRATLDSERNTIRISGGELHVVDQNGESQFVPSEHQFELDLTQMQWRRLK